MHNLHLVVVKANSAKEACENVEGFVEGFGNDNNYFEICGCISKSNRVYNTGNGRYSPESTEMTTIAKINKTVRAWMKGSIYTRIASEILKKAKGKINLKKWTSSELYSLKRLAEHEFQCSFRRDKKFNVLENEFYEYQYDNCGVTHCQEEDGRYTYIVFVDMHS
jgi:hypothetical protein